MSDPVLSRPSDRDTEKGRVLHALGLPWRDVPAVIEDAECRPFIDALMASVRKCAADLNRVIERAAP